MSEERKQGFLLAPSVEQFSLFQKRIRMSINSSTYNLVVTKMISCFRECFQANREAFLVTLVFNAESYIPPRLEWDFYALSKRKFLGDLKSLLERKFLVSLINDSHLLCKHCKALIGNLPKILVDEFLPKPLYLVNRTMRPLQLPLSLMVDFSKSPVVDFFCPSCSVHFSSDISSSSCSLSEFWLFINKESDPSMPSTHEQCDQYQPPQDPPLMDLIDAYLRNANLMSHISSL